MESKWALHTKILYPEKKKERMRQDSISSCERWTRNCVTGVSNVEMRQDASDANVNYGRRRRCSSSIDANWGKATSNAA